MLMVRIAVDAAAKHGVRIEARWAHMSTSRRIPSARRLQAPIAKSGTAVVEMARPTTSRPSPRFRCPVATTGA
jgi:hypothetical protein